MRHWWRGAVALSAQMSGGYSAEAVALFARMTTPPTDARKVLINSLIVSLKTAGVWDKLDDLKVYAAADSQAALLNWVASTQTATEVNAPAFVADRGYTGNGTTSYLNLNYNPGDGGTHKFLRDDAHMGLWSRTDLDAAVIDMGGRTTNSTAQNCIGVRITNAFSVRLNSDAATAVAGAASSIGHFVARRSAAGATAGFKNGASLGTGALASVAIASRSFFLGAVNTGGVAGSFTTRQYAASHAGGNLSDAEISAFYNALNTYMTAVGA